MEAAHQAIEAAARDSHAQLLAFLAARAGGDLAGAEDALSEAFVAALRQWPAQGVPDKPEAWLLHTARRKLIDVQRRDKRHARHLDALQHAVEAAQVAVDSSDGFPDERLKLLFVCAHPAIDAAARTPLMLQMVLGLEADRIAPAFLASPVAMSQRLVRAKAKIRDAGIPFIVPEKSEWPKRLEFVLDAVYAAFTCGWETPPGQDSGTGDLAGESIRLARLLVDLLPGEPEALGLLALLLHSHARQAARFMDGLFVPLQEQETARWDHALILQAETALTLAARQHRIGRFQLEAAIQSVHAQRAVHGETNWAAITLLYEQLIGLTPSLGARIGHVVALAKSSGAAVALTALEKLPADSLKSHQPYWATRAYLLHELGESGAARDAFQRAIGLTEDPAVRAFLMTRSKLCDCDAGSFRID